VPTEVLLVEDSSGDVRLTREAFRDADASINVHVANDGVEAMAFLRREGIHANAPRPCLILLDLNLPKMGGCFEGLRTPCQLLFKQAGAMGWLQHHYREPEPILGAGDHG
jgi:CheY-like chemotaxis protein